MKIKSANSGIVGWLLLCISISPADAQVNEVVAGEVAVIGAESEAVIRVKAADAGLEVGKASGLAMVESRSAYEKQLLEFVSPANRSSTLRDSLTNSLISAVESGDERFADLAADYESAAASGLYQERQIQSMQFIGQMNMMRGVGGTQDIIKRSIKSELDAMVLELQKKSFETQLLRRQARVKNHLRAIQEIDIAPLQAATGNQQNFLLEILQGKVLEYGYSVSQATPLGIALMQLKLSDDDLSRIRVKKLTEGGYISFGLLEGSGTLGQLPFILRGPELRDEVARVESLLSALASSDGQSQEFVDKTIELRHAVAAYEAAFLEQAGTAQQAARKGVQYYTKWTKGRDYFTGLKATVNCLELENNPGILQNRLKYNSEQYGSGILPLVTFIATNSCQFAQAAPGDEDVYVRLHRGLLELQAVLATE